MAKKSRIFETQYYNLGESITKYYMDNGIGCLAAKISSYNDAISKYSTFLSHGIPLVHQ